MTPRWLVVVAVVVGCGDGGSGSGSGGAGIAAAQALGAAMAATSTVTAPWRCALPRSAADAAATPAGWKRTPVSPGPMGTSPDGSIGDKLVAEPAGTKLTIGAVAQARGRVVDVRDKLRAANVDVVVAVGGMGTDAAESRAALTALLDPAWLVVALPGDTEQWPEHAAAIADLAAGGSAIVDGSIVRIVDTGVAVIGTLPGEPFASRLGAGADGCLHDAADLSAALAAISDAASGRPRVLVTPPAPQGGASDIAPGGLHAGDPALADAVAKARIELVVHGPVDGTPPPPGTARKGTPVTLAAGSLDSVARRDAHGRTLATGVTLATVDARGITWRFIPAPSQAAGESDAVQQGSSARPPLWATSRGSHDPVGFSTGRPRIRAGARADEPAHCQDAGFHARGRDAGRVLAPRARGRWKLRVAR